MEKLKKVLVFFLIAIAFIGGVGGFGYACYIHEYMIAVGIVCLAVMAVPGFIRAWKVLEE